VFIIAWLRVRHRGLFAGMQMVPLDPRLVPELSAG
jgi:hypothetical protein